MMSRCEEELAGPALPGLSLVLPAHNEEPVIAQAIAEACEALDDLGVPHEIIVVDDGSRDATAQVARAATVNRPQVRIISLGRNVGYAEALRNGFRAARYELVAFTDADCQFDLLDLGKLLELCRTHDIACGERADRQDPWRRKVYSKGFNILARALLGTQVRDCDCALKIFRRDWVNSAGLTCQGFFFNAELLCRARQDGLTIGEVPVTHRPRPAGDSKVSIWHIPPVLKTLVQFWWSRALFSEPTTADETNRNTRLGLPELGFCLLLVMLAGLIWARLRFPLMDPDESRYAQIAQEMVVTGNWLVPKRLGQPYLDKPPLLYWTTALAFRGLGISEATVHLIPALASLITVFSTFLLGRRLVGSLGAAVGSLLLLCSAGFLLSGRFLFMDSLLTSWTTLGFLAALVEVRTPRVSWGPWLLSAVACGLGILTKGPIAPVLIATPVAASLWLTGRISQLSWKLLASYAAMVLAIALPWFVALAWAEPGALTEFVWKHHVERFVSGLEHAEPVWFFVPVVCVAMLPCSILWPATWAFFASREQAVRARRDWDVGSLLLGAGWVFLLFSAARCKLPPYILPMFPPLCLVMGVAVWGIIEGCSQHKFVTYVRLHSPRDLCILLTLAVPVAASIDALLSVSLGGANWFAWGLLAVVGTGLLMPRTLSGYAITTRWIAASSFALLAMIATTFDFYPRIALSRSFIHPLRQVCPQELAEGIPVVSVGLSREIDSLSFYFPDLSLAVFDQWSVLEAAHTLPDRGQTLLLIDESLVDEFLENSGGETNLREVAHIHPCRVFESLPRERVAKTVTAAHTESTANASPMIRQTSATR
ncbi:MAG: glycosyltransferase [Planctomycetaceae bacterium]